MMNLSIWTRGAPIAVAILVFVVVLTSLNSKSEGKVQETGTPLPVLSVAMVQPQAIKLAIHVAATGNIVAWQEASVSAEGEGLKLIEVNANVGDNVKRGQVLARFDAGIVNAELAVAEAAVVQAEAAAMEADLNYKRAKTLENSKAISVQQLDQNRVATITARASLDAARATAQKNRLRLAQVQVLAPSAGIITARSATVGTVVPAAQELFRLIEDGRLEWRAVIASADMDKLAPGQTATITLRDQQAVQGKLRMVGPTIDSGTHNGLIYVDLPPHAGLRAGTFARGYVAVGESLALCIPQSAVILRDGFHYVMQVSSSSMVTVKKVSVGRQVGECIEITAGLIASEAVIASGLGFLSEGDLVKVVSETGNNAQESSLSNPLTANTQELPDKKGLN